MKIKAIVAGILATLSLGANAASIATHQIGAATTGAGSELYVEVFDASATGANAGKTYFGNLGVISSQFNASAAQSWNLGADANWTSFYTAGDTYKFNVVGGVSNATGITFTTYGDYVTGGTGTPNFFAGVAVSLNAMSGSLQAITSNASNLNVGTSGSGVVAAGQPTSYDVNFWDSLQNQTIFDANHNNGTSAGANVANNFYHLGLASGPTRFNTQLLGTFTLNTATQSLDFASASAPATVPVPGAIWLVGSALLGLVRFGFRKIA